MREVVGSAFSVRAEPWAQEQTIKRLHRVRLVRMALVHAIYCDSYQHKEVRRLHCFRSCQNNNFLQRPCSRILSVFVT